MSGVNRKKAQVQFRYYEIPQNQPVLALLGEKWIQNYGAGVEFLHFHNHMEIGFCYGGQGDLVLDETVHRFDADMFSVIPKNYPHTTNSDFDAISRWEYLFVDVESFLRDCYPNNLMFAEDIAKRVNRRASFVRVEEQPVIARMILEILDEMRDKEEFYVETVRGILLSLLLNIARMNRVPASKVRNQMTGITQIAKAMDYVSDNYFREISVPDLAKECHMSETHFRRIFQKHMNMAPADYVNFVRIQMACEYMKKHTDSMETVAVKCGFQTVSTFNRNFKKVVGITPYQWKIHPENYEARLLNYKISAYKGW